MKVITESEMDFGPFDEKNLFHIEESRIYKDLGTGIKTVEFILKYSENSIVFLEAKTRCPNAANRDESEEKEDKFEEYYSSVTEKFVASLQIYLASVLHRYQDTSEVGEALLIREQIYRYRVEYLKEDESRNRLVKEHEKITRAIKERDVKAAQELSFEHLENQRMGIIQAIRAEE